MENIFGRVDGVVLLNQYTFKSLISDNMNKRRNDIKLTVGICENFEESLWGSSEVIGYIGVYLVRGKYGS